MSDTMGKSRSRTDLAENSQCKPRRINDLWQKCSSAAHKPLDGRMNVPRQSLVMAAEESADAKMDGLEGVRNLLPERPAGCCAQKVPDPFRARRQKRIDVLRIQ